MNPVEDMKKGIEPYVAAFERQQTEAGPASSWLSELRGEAFASFVEHGFPTTKEEGWKYTNVRPIADASFLPATRPGLSGLSAEQITPFFFPKENWIRLVFINGFLAAEFSQLASLPKEVQLGGLAQLLQSNPEWIEKNFSQHARDAEDSFAAFNTAFFQDGAGLFLPKGIVLDTPIHLIYLTANAQGTASFPRNLFVASEGSRAAVIETHVALEESAYLVNAVSEWVLDQGAEITRYKLQVENKEGFHISRTQVICGQDAHFKSHAVDLGATLARNQLNVILNAPGSECTLNGLYVGEENQHFDNQLLVDHAKPHGTSHQLYKGIMDDHASGVFSGKVFVRENAQQTDAEQTNKNLLLSDHARVDTKPQLEIFADDVKCSHGATVGQLDPEALFYLKSRGIGEENSRNLLTFGFAEDVVDRMALMPIQSRLNQVLLKRLHEPGAA